MVVLSPFGPNHRISAVTPTAPPSSVFANRHLYPSSDNEGSRVFSYSGGDLANLSVLIFTASFYQTTMVSTNVTVTNGAHQDSIPDIVPLIIGGKDVVGSNKFPVRNPADGKVIWEAGGASVTEAAQAVEVAQEAFPAWSKVKPAARRDIFLKAADLFAKRKDELAQYQTEETGADPRFVEWILNLTVDNLKEVAGKCSAVVGSIPFSTEEGRGAFVLKEPYGVILGIAPWYVQRTFDDTRIY